MWYKSKGKDSDIVISSRIRLARNLKDFRFCGKMSGDDANAIIEKTKGALDGKKFKFIALDNLDKTDKLLMLEQHLISRELAEGRYPSGVFTDANNEISVMVNEEDHIRMQCIVGGYDLDGAYEKLNALDSAFEERIEFAFDENYGYLTKCPTNTGTGMRASVMLHLPGLAITGNINNVIAAVNKLGIAVRGLYGEGSKSAACIYQVSNQVTLGITEEETIENLKIVVDMLIEKERQVTKALYDNNPLQFKDKVGRAYATLAGAYIMTNDEFMKLIPYVRMGKNMGIIKVEDTAINSLIIELSPAHVSKLMGASNAAMRDEKRASKLREVLGKEEK